MAIVSISKVKKFLQITGSDKDDLINALIPQVEGDYLLIRNAPFDEDSNDVIEYPDGAELVAAQMIAFHMTSLAQSGGAYKSETIGSYSYTSADGDGALGYPVSITGRIERFIGVK